MAAPHPPNNFDALRLAAATSVILSHAILLSTGQQSGDPLMLISHGQCILGLVGVFVFFIVSGYLVTQSWDQTGSVLRFLAKRGLRIYPAYAACLVLLTFGLGTLTTSLDLRAYLAAGGTWDFLAANLAMQVEHNGLPGVRFTDWPFGTIVDGPLWSLPCEVVLYLMVALLGSLRLLRLPVLLGLLAAGVACLWFDTANSPWFIGGVGWLLGFFAAGMIGYELRARSLFHPALALGAAVGILVTLQLGGFVLWFPLLGGYLTLYLAFSRTLPLLAAAAFGDLSYGMYIYGWPVEQTVLQRFGLLPWWQVFLLSLPLAAALAFLSWHIVEKPALRLKPRPRATLGPAQGDGEPA